VLLARGETRSREIAVRLALGARRWRIVRLLLTESGVISAIGGAAGILLAWWAFRALLPAMLSSVPRLSQPKLDADPNAAMLWFGLAITMATALACGALPAVRASTPDLHGAMKRDGAGVDGRPRSWLRGALISVQVAVCLVLLVSASLLLRGLYAAYTVDPGFRYQDVTVVSVDLRGPRYGGAASAAVRQQIVDALAVLPGVANVARVGRAPLAPGRSQASFRLPNADEALEFDVNAVSPSYFDVLAIPIVNGRTFSAADLDRGGAVEIRWWRRRTPAKRSRSSASQPTRTSRTWPRAARATCIWPHPPPRDG
jgi:putative ABC transport system permease protein